MFIDRADAGRKLAERLLHFKNQQPAPVILGLPRGGVVVAAEVARALIAPLDVMIVRKLGAPHQPELAIGAVTDGNNPHTVLNDEIVSVLGVSEDYLNEETDRQMEEVRRLQQVYRHGREAISTTDRTVIVVDDGIATGATVRAGIAAIRNARPARLILAVPVAASDTIQSIQDDVDECVCLHAPTTFIAVGRFYTNFGQTSDSEVEALLDESSKRCESQSGG